MKVQVKMDIDRIMKLILKEEICYDDWVKFRRAYESLPEIGKGKSLAELSPRETRALDRRLHKFCLAAYYAASKLPREDIKKEAVLCKALDELEHPERYLFPED